MARNCMACKRSKDRWGLHLDRSLVDLIDGTNSTLVSEASSILPSGGPLASSVPTDKASGRSRCSEGRPLVRI